MNYAGNIVENRYFEDPALIAAWADKLDLVHDCLEWGLEIY